MHLADYLDACRLTAEDFAKHTDIPERIIENYVKGSQMPSNERMATIYQKTHGYVTHQHQFEFYKASKHKVLELL